MSEPTLSNEQIEALKARVEEAGEYRVQAAWEAALIRAAFAAGREEQSPCHCCGKSGCQNPIECGCSTAAIQESDANASGQNLSEHLDHLAKEPSSGETPSEK